MKFILSAFLLTLSLNISAETLNIRKILSLNINSSINPATLDFIQKAHKKAKAESFDLILIKLNTPGGLVTTTKDILTTFGESDIPFAVWIKPEGASATSAGAIIASGAHILSMSDGTNIGAATPVQMGKDIKQSDLRDKAINDLVALVKSLAETRGRNAKAFGEMIEKASSFKAKEAKEKKLIDFIANSQEEFLQKIENFKVKIKGKNYNIKLNNPGILDFEMSFGQRLLNTFANPSLAYILFLIGAALIYLELQAPGGLIAGSIGAFCLILAGIGFQVLPLNFGAMLLMILSFILFIVEMYVTSYGLLSIAGLISLLSGSFLLFETDNSYLHLQASVIYSSVGAVMTFLLFVLYMMLKDQNKIGSKKFNSMEGKTGKVIDVKEKEGDLFQYSVKVSGEIWMAESNQEYKLDDQVHITQQNNEKMKLLI